MPHHKTEPDKTSTAKKAPAPDGLLISPEELTRLGVHIWDEISKGIALIMPGQLLPVVNEIFGQTYPPDAHITFLSTEYSDPRDKEGHPYPMVMTDITFRIDCADHKDDGAIYHLEFQMSDDNDISIRMVRYDFAIAMQHNLATDAKSNTLELSLPRSAVIYPVGLGRHPASLSCTIRFPDGSCGHFKIPTVEIQRYALEELHTKHLAMFLPFTLLRFRDRLNNAGSDFLPPLTPQELTGFLNEIILILEEECTCGRMTQFEHSEYLRLIYAAAERVFHRHPDLWKEATVMLETKIKSIAQLIAERDAVIAEQDAVIAEQGTAIAEKNNKIVELTEEILQLQEKLNLIHEKNAVMTKPL